MTGPEALEQAAQDQQVLDQALREEEQDPVGPPSFAARFKLWIAASEEADHWAGSVPGPKFYNEKLPEAWARATHTAAYADLGEWSWEAFWELGVTDKSTLKESPWDFTTVGVDDAAKYYETTGTTGTVTPTPRLREDIAWNVMSVTRAWSAVLSTADRALSLLPSDIVPVGDLVVDVCAQLDITHTRSYPYAAGISDWDRVLGVWQRLQPTVIFAAPGVVLELTRLLKQRGIMADFAGSVTAIMLLGEVSSPPMRDRIAGWWGASVRDASYGSTETGTIAATCVDGNLHLLPAAHLVEIHGAGGTGALVIHGEPLSAHGRLVVTPLNAHARPLLRLDTGDDVTIGEPCGCDLDTPRIRIHGRASDEITIDGVTVSVEQVERLVYTHSPAMSYLVEVSAAADDVRLLLERDPEEARDKEAGYAEALRLACERAGLPCSEVNWLNSLPRSTKSGASQKNWKRTHVRRLES